MNTVIIVIGVILLIVIFYNLFKSYFTSTSVILSSSNMNVQLPAVSHTTLVNPTSTRYYYLLWIYVNSWDKNNTTNNRIIFSRNNDVALYLDPKANLVCQINPQQSVTTAPNTTTNINVTSNFPLQKWVCIEINLDNTVVDVYLDGKMIKSVQVPQVSPDNISDINFGVFDANMAQFTRTSTPLDPQTAWNNYLAGNGNSVSNYNLTLSVLKDNIVTSKFSLR